MSSNAIENESAKLEKARPSEESGSAEQLEGQKRNLLLDFFYHDHRRVSLFLAQLETYGLLRQVKATEAASHTGTTRTTKSAGAGLTSLLKGEMSLGETVTDDERDEAERTYDPLWANARRFMDYLAGTNLVESDIGRARIGHFIHIFGTITIIDTSLLRNLWESQTVTAELKRRWKKGEIPGQPKPTPQQIEHQQIMFEMLPKWPHGTQLTIDGTGFSAWGTLAEDCTITTAGEIALKHGYEIPGTWHVLGILDATPSPLAIPINVPEIAQSPTEALNNMKSIGKNLSNSIRSALGRPVDKYGITPILIFREVSG